MAPNAAPNKLKKSCPLDHGQILHSQLRLCSMCFRRKNKRPHTGIWLHSASLVSRFYHLLVPAESSFHIRVLQLGAKFAGRFHGIFFQTALNIAQAHKVPACSGARRPLAPPQTLPDIFSSLTAIQVAHRAQ